MVIIAAVLASGCVSAPPPMAERDFGWLASAAGRPPGDSGRDCIDSALRTSYALVAFQSAQSSDAFVRSSLTDDVQLLKLPSLRAQRLRESALWTRHHDPAEVGADHLNECLAVAHIRLPAGLWPLQCLRSTELTAFLSVARYTGRSQTQAAQAAAVRYRAAPTGASFDSLADAVYGAPTQSADLALRAMIFSKCMAAAP